MCGGEYFSSFVFGPKEARWKFREQRLRKTYYHINIETKTISHQKDMAKYAEVKEKQCITQMVRLVEVDFGRGV